MRVRIPHQSPPTAYDITAQLPHPSPHPSSQLGPHPLSSPSPQTAKMSKPGKYLLLSLPTSIVPSHHKEDALDAVSTTVSPENGSAASFPIPEFKIGTLDALVQQADELAKLEGQCQGVVAKVGDALKNILDGDEAQIERMKVVNDSMFVPFTLNDSGPVLTLSRACGPVPSFLPVEQGQVPCR